MTGVTDQSKPHENWCLAGENALDLFYNGPPIQLTPVQLLSTREQQPWDPEGWKIEVKEGPSGSLPRALAAWLMIAQSYGATRGQPLDVISIRPLELDEQLLHQPLPAKLFPSWWEWELFRTGLQDLWDRGWFLMHPRLPEGSPQEEIVPQKAVIQWEVAALLALLRNLTTRWYDNPSQVQFPVDGQTFQSIASQVSGRKGELQPSGRQFWKKLRLEEILLPEHLAAWQTHLRLVDPNK